jgi:hypothetical protein
VLGEAATRSHRARARCRARRRGGRIARSLVGHGILEGCRTWSACGRGLGASRRVPDLPEEVLTDDDCHKHFFPISNDHGKLLPVFLAVHERSRSIRT